MTVFTVLSYAAVALLTLSYSVSAARVKIQLEPNFSYADLVSGESACTDVVDVERSSIDLYGNLEQLREYVTFHRSAIATENLAVFTTTRVPGLDGQTIGDVFEVMREAECLPFYIGGAVRDQFLNRVPSDADVEVDCSIDYFVEVCIANWGASNCRRGGHLAHVGNNTIVDQDLRDMDIGSTDGFFYVPLSAMEYTVNSMAFDMNGNDVIIDITITGQVDACNKHIRIPSSDGSLESWNAWKEQGSKVLYRYWKLRYKGLDAFDKRTRRFITVSTMKAIIDDPSSFSDFYCHYVLDGDYTKEGNKCDIAPKDCEDSQSKAEVYNEKFAEDLGWFWHVSGWLGLLPSNNCE